MNSHVTDSPSWFTRLSRRIAHASGRPMAFALALGSIVVWLITGPIFKFSDTWQLVINTGTTIVTFMMVFLIQNTQNVDTAALHLKLDEVIRATQGAHNMLMNLEDLDEAQLERFRELYASIAAKAQEEVKAGLVDVDTPDLAINGDNE